MRALGRGLEPPASLARSRLAARPATGLLAALLLAGCAVDGPEPRHVLLITVDTLRADHMSLYGYPRATSEYLEKLGAAGVVFERAIAQWPQTGSSFASLFTGRYPQTTGLTQGAAVELPGDHLTLAELLSDRGFATGAVVSNAVLRRELGWDQGFDEYLQTWDLAPGPIDDPVAYRQWINARRVNELALPLLDRLRAAPRVFLWLHYSDPHAPYFLPEGVDNPFLGDRWDDREAPAKIDRRVRARALGDNRELGYYVAHYDANIRLADQHIRQVLERARALGLLEDALIVFTADHGESLGEHNFYFGHGRLPYNASIHVPLVIVHPGAAAGRRVAAPVELVDLFPTLQSLVASEVEVGELEGDSLTPLLADPAAHREALGTPRYAFSQAGHGSPKKHFRSVQDERWKLIFRPARGKRREVRWELYRLDVDPMETRDLARQETEPYRRLRRELEAWMRAPEVLPRPESARARGEETVEALRALGYVD
jgi:arylsulfatase A-like enzyme